MKFITRDDIENWASTYDSKGYLPGYVSKLVRAVTPNDTQSQFPEGSSVFVGGWDGIVETTQGSQFVPNGISLWEFGTTKAANTKAAEDFGKRDLNPLGYKKEECTYIFLTPRFFQNKDQLKQEIEKKGEWKGVRIYDSRDIEEWFSIAYVPARIFASEIGKYPYEGSETSIDFWEEWSFGPKGAIPPKLVTSGREKEILKLESFFDGHPGIKGVQASTKNEAIAFIIASSFEFKTNNKISFDAKTLIIDDENTYRGVRKNFKTPLNLIPRFENAQPLYAAVGNGHHVIVPLGADDSFNQEIISLPPNDREGQVQAILSLGLDEEEASMISKEAGRNVTIIRKFLGHPEYRATWLEDEQIKSFLPFLLAGRFSIEMKGDKEVLTNFCAGNSNETIERLALKWSNVEFAPLLQIGSMYRLLSPLDSWINTSHLIVDSDLKVFKENFLHVLRFGDQKEEREDNLPTFFPERNKYSGWIKNGLCYTSILLAINGCEWLKKSSGDGQEYVDSLIFELMNDLAPEEWNLLASQFQLLAEASPESFLTMIDASLESDEKNVMSIFQEYNEGIHFGPSGQYPNLLWALESLCWLPDFIQYSTDILIKLSELDPGGKLNNRPYNSLCEIYNPWHVQSLTSHQEYIELLERIIKTNSEVGFNLMLDLLPNKKRTAFNTSEFRWRKYNIDTKPFYNRDQIHLAYETIQNHLISSFTLSDSRKTKLLKSLEYFNKAQQDKLLALLNEEKDETNYSLWKELRDTLSFHKSNPDNNFGLSETQLQNLEKLYIETTPSNLSVKYKWLFDDVWLNLPEGFVYDSNNYKKGREEKNTKSKELRVSAISEILSKEGFDFLIAFSKEIKIPALVGDSYAQVHKVEKTQETILKLLNNNAYEFLKGFLNSTQSIKGFDFLKNQFLQVQEKISPKDSCEILLGFNQEEDFFNFLKTLDKGLNDLFWKEMNPMFYRCSPTLRIENIKKLNEVGRPVSSIGVLNYNSEEYPSELIHITLMQAMSENNVEDRQIDRFTVKSLYNELNNRKEDLRSELIELEWYYLPVFDSGRFGNNPEKLHSELNQNPGFFVEVLETAYYPEGEQIEKEFETEDAKQKFLSKSRRAFDLLNNWKGIPGRLDDGTMDTTVLLDWINIVRESANKSKRLKVADLKIGKTLAHLPIDPENIWPPEVICNFMEDTNSEHIFSGFSSELFNMRGFSSRGPYDGGDIEREKAEYFNKLNSKLKGKYKKLSQVFVRLKKNYLNDARRQDDMAERDKLER